MALTGLWMSRRAMIGGLAAGALGMFGAHAGAQEQTVTIATPGAALHFYPFYVADAGGLFEEEGITIDWVDVGAGSRQIAAVAGGSADFAVVGMQPAVTARQNGADLVTVAALFRAYPIQLVLSNEALEKTGISPEMSIDEKVEKLSGISVGVTGIGSTTDVLLRSWLEARGKDPEQALTIQPLGSPPAMYAAFEQGAIDGFMLGAPFPEQAEASGIGKIVIDPLKGGIPELEDVPYTGVIAGGAMVRDKPELVEKMVRAVTKAIKLTSEQPDQAADLVQTFFKETDPALFETFEPNYRANAAKSPVISESAYDKLLEWIAITSDTPVTVTYGDFVVAEHAEKAASEILK